MIVLSCQDKNWETFDSHIKNKGDLIYFVNKDLGYVAGSNDEMINPEDEFPKFISHSYIAITKDGGRTWKDISPNFRGKINKLQAFENGGIVAVLEDDVIRNSTLIVSENYGRTWKQLFKQYISNIYFKNIKEGELLFLDKEKKTHYVKFENNKFGNEVIFNTRLWGKIKDNYYVLNSKYNYQKQNDFCENIQLINLKKQERFISFEKNIVYTAFAETEKYLYLLVENENLESRILKFDGKKFFDISLGKYQNYSAFDFYAFNKTLVLNAYKNNSGSILGVTKCLLYSTDEGKNWQLKDMPDNLLATPQFMYKDQFFITGTFGGFQKYNFKN